MTGLPPDDPRHGTSTAYVYWRCRCDRCREVNRLDKERWRRNNGVLPTDRAPMSEHGTRSKYTHGCHCDDCRVAEREYKRRYRAREAGVVS